jgi:hypothetical protein
LILWADSPDVRVVNVGIGPPDGRPVLLEEFSAS